MSEQVSRETPSAPEVARRVFSHPGSLEAAEALASLLADAGVERGLIGPREVPRLWERHLLNCAVLSDALPGEAVSVCDVGSGAGLPGLVLAIREPRLQVTLLEPLLRRTTFLEEAAAQLGLDNVQVLRGRAEEFHGEQAYEVVTSRAVAPLDRLSKWCLPLVAPGGQMIAMKGASAPAEVERHAGLVRRLGGGSPTVERYGEAVLATPTTVVRVRRERGA